MGIDLTLTTPPQGGGPAAASRLPGRPGGPARDGLAPKGREFGDLVASLAGSERDRPARADGHGSDRPDDVGEASHHGTAGETEPAPADLVPADGGQQAGAHEPGRVDRGAFGWAPTASQLLVDHATHARVGSRETSRGADEDGVREGEPAEDAPDLPGDGAGPAAVVTFSVPTHLADAATPVNAPGQLGPSFREQVARAGHVAEEGHPISAPGGGLAPSGTQPPGTPVEPGLSPSPRPPLGSPLTAPPDAAAAAPDPSAIVAETAPASPPAENLLPAAGPIADRRRPTPDTGPPEPGRSRPLADLLRGLVGEDDGGTPGPTPEGERARAVAPAGAAIFAGDGHAPLDSPTAGPAEGRRGTAGGPASTVARGDMRGRTAVGVPVGPGPIDAGVPVPDGASSTSADPVAHPVGGARTAWQARLAEILPDQSPGWTVAAPSGDVARAGRPDGQVTAPTAPVRDAVTAPESWSGALAGTPVPTSAASAAAARSLSEVAASAKGLSDNQGVVPQVVKAIHLQWRQGLGEARLRLEPANLGEVQVTLRVRDGAVSALLRAETPAVQAWIDARQQELRGALEHQGLRLEHFEVVVDPDGRREPNRDQLPFARPRPARARADAPRFEVSA